MSSNDEMLSEGPVDDVPDRATLIVRGTVCSGFGAAQRDVRSGVYHDVLDFAPYPGTLNLRVTGKYKMPRPEAMVDFFWCPLYVWKANWFKDWLPMAAVIPGEPNQPGATPSPPDVLELLAPVNLRHSYNLENGDKIEVQIYGKSIREHEATAGNSVVRWPNLPRHPGSGHPG